MTAEIIDCERVADDLLGRATEELEALRSAAVPIALAAVVIGDDPLALGEQRRLEWSASALGVACESVHLPEQASEAQVVRSLRSLSADPELTAIVAMRPFPAGLDEISVGGAIEPIKDVDAIGPDNLGLLVAGRPRYIPTTAAAIYAVLDTWIADRGYEPGDFYRRSRIVVVGGVNEITIPAVLVGCLRQAPIASVDPGSSVGPQFGWYTRHADVLIVAAGTPALIRAEHVREGAIVLDAGVTTRGHADGTAGDVLFDEVAERALAITAGPEALADVRAAALIGNAIRAARDSAPQHLDLVGGRS